jgi:hypothetical protein
MARMVRSRACWATWMTERAKSFSLKAKVWEEWVIGFVSGANIYTDNPELFDQQMNASAIYARIDDYCRSNPLEGVYDASFALVKELLRRAIAEKTRGNQ